MILEISTMTTLLFRAFFSFLLTPSFFTGNSQRIAFANTDFSDNPGITVVHMEEEILQYVNLDRKDTHKSQWSGSYVQISVTDSGRGMDSKTEENILITLLLRIS